MWLHFYDEGLFYDGFYVINDLEVSFLISFSRTNHHDSQDGYAEADGRVFIYNSDSDDCVEDTGRNWYYWDVNKDDWYWDDSIYMTPCN